MIVFREPKVYVTKAKRTTTRLNALSKQMGRAVQLNLVKGIKSFKRSVSDREIFNAWKTGSYAKVMEVIPWNKLPDHLSETNKGIEESLTKASAFTIPSLPPPLKKEFRFDTKNPYIENYMRKRSGILVQGITTDAQQVIANAVTRSFDRALRPSEVATMIKGSIGLYPRLETALNNYREGLIKQNLPPERVQSLTEKYNDRLLDYRATTIGRTETRFATNYGQLAVWKQGADQGLIDRGSARKIWVAQGDEPCDVCDPMDGVSVPLDEFWSLNNGQTVEIPTESHPNCMCDMQLDFGKSEEILETNAPEE